MDQTICDNMDDSYNVTLSRKSQTQKNTDCMIPFMKFKHSSISKITYVVRCQNTGYSCLEKGEEGRDT